jgi:hypothetical protein
MMGRFNIHSDARKRPPQATHAELLRREYPINAPEHPTPIDTIVIARLIVFDDSTAHNMTNALMPIRRGIIRSTTVDTLPPARNSATAAIKNATKGKYATTSPNRLSHVMAFTMLSVSVSPKLFPPTGHPGPQPFP